MWSTRRRGTPSTYPSMGVRGSGQATRQKTTCSDGATFAKKLGSAMCQGAGALYRASVGEPALSTANKHCAGGCWPHHPWLSTSTVRERIRIPPCSADKKQSTSSHNRPIHSPRGLTLACKVPSPSHHATLESICCGSIKGHIQKQWMDVPGTRPAHHHHLGCQASLLYQGIHIHGDKTRAGSRDPALWRGPLCFIVASITQHPSG